MEDRIEEAPDSPEESPSAPADRAVLARARALLPSLQPSDARVAQLLLDEPDAVIYQSVSEVAEAARTSTATVVRCAQKLGFRGFHDLKLALAHERAALAAVPDEPVASVDPRLAVLSAVLSAGARTVKDAGALVDPAAFEAVVRALSACERVVFVGVGTSAPLIHDAAYRFSAIGLRADAYGDVHVQHLQAHRLGGRDVCVAVSHTGSTRETLEAVRAARDAGAVTVAITSFAHSPLTELVDHVILSGTREVSFELEAMASRLAHLAMLDALLVSVAERDRDRARAALELYSDMLGEHRL